MRYKCECDIGVYRMALFIKFNYTIIHGFLLGKIKVCDLLFPKIVQGRLEIWMRLYGGKDYLIF